MMQTSEHGRMTILRVIVDPPDTGPVNMARDEAIALAVAAGGPSTLRFYAWTPATLSLGYFQRLAARDEHLASRGCPVVRRASGGGAIVHDRELTYCLAIERTHPAARHPVRLYDAVHESLCAALALLGVRARQFKESRHPSRQAFLCFQRRARGDVLVGEHKIAGSAQRRWRGAVIQHGSILLATSRAAPELPGLREIAGEELDRSELIARWRPLFAAACGGVESADRLTDAERETVEQIARDKYGADAWTAMR